MRIASLLTQAVGAEKSREVVAETARFLGVPPDHISRMQATAILDQLASRGGLLGIAARFAKSRFILTSGR